MACTVAVEESIANHYNNQIRTLMEEEPGKYKELLQVMDFNDGRKVEGPVSGGEGC
jgi:demethoxyubiquinone hydroxylase (CLK1/Coq7/Cat5 family)